MFQKHRFQEFDLISKLLSRLNMFKHKRCLLIDWKAGNTPSDQCKTLFRAFVTSTTINSQVRWQLITKKMWSWYQVGRKQKTSPFPGPILFFYSPDFPLDVCSSSFPCSQSELCIFNASRLIRRKLEDSEFSTIDIDIAFLKSSFRVWASPESLLYSLLRIRLWSFADMSSLQLCARYAQALRLESDPYDRCLSFMAFDSIAWFEQWDNRYIFVAVQTCPNNFHVFTKLKCQSKNCWLTCTMKFPSKNLWVFIFEFASDYAFQSTIWINLGEWRLQWLEAACSLGGSGVVTRCVLALRPDPWTSHGRQAALQGARLCKAHPKHYKTWRIITNHDKSWRKTWRTSISLYPKNFKESWNIFEFPTACSGATEVLER